jgi:hypothetical protein
VTAPHAAIPPAMKEPGDKCKQACHHVSCDGRFANLSWSTWFVLSSGVRIGSIDSTRAHTKMAARNAQRVEKR